MVVWINLREDLGIQCGAATYSPREKDFLEEPINLSGISAQALEVSVPVMTKNHYCDVCVCETVNIFLPAHVTPNAISGTQVEKKFHLNGF